MPLTGELSGTDLVPVVGKTRWGRYRQLGKNAIGTAWAGTHLSLTGLSPIRAEPERPSLDLCSVWQKSRFPPF